jgi:phage terminase Nu1 subunit (DNA packaging protein)
MALVGAAQLSKVLNLSQRRIRQLAVAGMPKAKRGRYDLAQCVTWHTQYLKRQSLMGRASNDCVRVARIALLEAQREKLVRENAQCSGQLIPLTVYTKCVATMITTAQAQLLSLPARVAPQLEGESRMVIKERLRREIHAALAALAVNGNGSADEPMGGDDVGHLTATPGASTGANVAHLHGGSV